MTYRLAAHGLSIVVPTGWEASITLTHGDGPGENGAEGTDHAVLHLANFALPNPRGDFGGSPIDTMASNQIFLALVEFDSAAASAPLYRQRGLATITADGFRRETMHRPVPGQAGHQQFFNEAGRAFCLYSAVGSYRRRQQLATGVMMVMSTLRID
ncbi:MAG: hypothetical protein GY812_00195 [Actinomycetia bacterium]|nr:hypothetical protein [Actinomycetes bacterium]